MFIREQIGLEHLGLSECRLLERTGTARRGGLCYQRHVRWSVGYLISAGLGWLVGR
jgi:hypothetical protein